MTDIDTTTDLLPSLQVTTPTPAELGSLSNQQLRSKLAQAMELSARTLAYLAAVWRELESRGEDLSDLRVGLASYLPLIAAGQLDSQAVVRFAGSATLLRLVASLPVAEQRRLAAGDPVEVLTLQDDGTVTSTALPAHTLTATQVRMVFAPGHVRRADEQRAVLEADKLRRQRRARPGAEARVRYDARTDKIRIGNTSASVGEIVAAVIDAGQEPDPSDDLGSSIIVKLTDTEHKALKIRATQADMTLQAYCRSLLITRSII